MRRDNDDASGFDRAPSLHRAHVDAYVDEETPDEAPAASASVVVCSLSDRDGSVSLSERSMRRRLALFAARHRELRCQDAAVRTDAPFMDRAFHDAFGVALSALEGLRRMHEEFFIERGEGDAKFRLVCLGASDAHELSRWLAFAAMRSIEGCGDVECALVGPALSRDGETFEAIVPSFYGDEGEDDIASLRVRTRRGLFPRDYDEPCDLYAAFNAGLPVGDDWYDAVAHVVRQHVTYQENLRSEKRRRLDRRPPSFWVSDYNFAAATIAFSNLQAIVDRALETKSDALRDAFEPVFVEPYLNPFRGPQVHPTSDTCELSSCNNAYAFAFVGLSPR